MSIFQDNGDYAAYKYQNLCNGHYERICNSMGKLGGQNGIIASVQQINIWHLIIEHSKCVLKI